MMPAIVFEFWYWWAFALALLVAEMLTPGFFFLWLAISAFVTGGMLLAVPTLSLEIQAIVFAVLSVLSIVGWQRYAKSHPSESDQPLLNYRGAQYIGRVFNLYEPIINGQGKIKVDDSIWKVQGPDCDISSRVKITGIRGVVFEVEKVED